MKKSLLALAVLSAISATASAQSNVTIYGVIDAAVRYTTNNATATGSASQTVLTEGAFQGGRLGFKGSEDLGGGTSAVFKLENGLVINTGAIDQQGQLFGRQAYVGLNNKDLGEIDLGRQYGVSFETMGNYDPLGVGNMSENEWEVFLFGIRFDNTLQYSKTAGPISVNVQYSLGEAKGSTSIGATTGGALAYTQGPLSIGGMVQQSKDANSKNLEVVGLGGSYTAGIATMYLSYFDAKRDPGFAKAGSNSGGPLANTSLLSNAGNILTRTDDVVTVGALFQTAPNMGYTIGYMHDSVKNESSLGDGGKISTLYAVADYNLSKRTDVYVEIDHTALSGGEVNGANSVMNFAAPLGGASERTGLALGLRHKF